ncbi:YidH family protein [Dietzia aurantiaca]|uniref:YidH family protein n=1 Tax=Dietzia aurantiaca TaxID=983873 RepID=A0ABV9PNE8_9ACTN
MTGDGGPGWRPRALRDGQEPDPRFTLANERTFLAWIRTSLGLTAGAVALEAFAGDEIPEIIRTPLACILLVLAAVLAIVAFRRWIRIEFAMRHKQPLPMPQASILLALGISIGAVVLIVAILSGTFT